MSSGQITVELRLDTDSPEETERFGMDLKSDLDAVPQLEVAPARSNAAPAGSKSAAGIDWSQLMLTLAASGGVLTTLIGVIQARLNRDRKAVLVIGNDKLELSGLDGADQRRVIEGWIERHRGKGTSRG